MKKIRNAVLLSIILVFTLLSPVGAQAYYFQVLEETVDAYYNADGTLDLVYVYTFANQQNASPIEYVDLGLPNSNFSLSNVSASVNGQTITDIAHADPQYLKNSANGVTVGLGANSIQPGEIGTVQITIRGITGVFYKYNKGETQGYASVRFTPNYFGSEYVTGSTNMVVSFHLPQGVTPDEPQWEQQTTWGGSTDPETALDGEGRVTYTWRNQAANASSEYEFSAAFPASYLPAGTVQTGIQLSDEVISNIICGCIFLVIAGVFGLIIYASIVGAKKRSLAYLPPKISIEGQGIKRGLTAVEAAILMEQPMDKVLTMILFGVIKKGAAAVTSRDPLEIKVTPPLPEGLQPYEAEFLDAYKEPDKRKRQANLQGVMVSLVKSISEKMKGFSRKETIAYYQDIHNRAWKQVEAADTPEVKSQKYDEVMEWTMLGKDYEDKTRETFNTGPVYVPMWWGNFDPTFHSPASTSPVSTGMPSGSGGGKTTINLPSLPGADFAASMVSGVQSAAGGLVGDITSFTSGITQKTNPVPPPTRSSSSYRGGGGGGGHSCACACACAGCACACAGGGR